MAKLILLLGLLGLAACSGSKSAIPESPNIVIILVDDLGKEWLSCYGAEDISTPNIDALAASGIQFSNVYSMPQCTPTRVTFLTGQYPFRHGWVNHWDVPRWGGGAHFDETVNPSLGREMKKAGYATAICGKWQIDDFRVEKDAMTRNGFDKYCMWTGYETGVDASANRYQDPYLFTGSESQTYDGAFGPDVFMAFIEAFIEDNKDRPFFIYYPMVLTHTPFVNTPDEEAQDNLGKHKAMVRYTDKITGRIVQSLEKNQVRDNTLVLWTTDNGTSGRITGSLDGRKVKGGKAKTTEPGICEPFIASWPARIKSHRISDALVDFSDFFPTCLDLAGMEPRPWSIVNGDTLAIDGYSFKDVLLSDAGPSQREWILGMGGGNNARLTENGVENQYVFRDRVIRNEQYKLYINSKREAVKFVDLVNDPFEEVNLIDSLNNPSRKAGFDALYNVVESFPEKDADPRYHANPPQSWDVAITAESGVWKK